MMPAAANLKVSNGDSYQKHETQLPKKLKNTITLFQLKKM